MLSKFGRRFHSILERTLPEQRLFLRSETDTRFIRLTPETQLVAIAGSALLIGWSTVASAILVLDTLGAGSERAQALREQSLYEERLNSLAAARDARAAEAAAAQERFAVALSEVSAMQSRLLASEERRRELEIGIDVIQTTLRDTMRERDTAREEAATVLAELTATEATRPDLGAMDEMKATIDFMADALSDVAEERDEIEIASAEREMLFNEMVMDDRLEHERQERIFTQIEDAVATSMAPLDEMFRSVDLPTDRILEQVRRTYSGQGGPLTPISFSASNDPHVGHEHGEDPLALRANEVLGVLDQLNLRRIAAEKIPFSMPVKGAYRFTSGFGMRWGRPHNGSDFAGAHGMPIYATADGVVEKAQRMSGYGLIVTIRHDFGYETRYAHLSKIRVKPGQRVSRGERIGDMGNTGRSTGTHLHYEVRVGSKPVDPMTYIKAARDVF